MIGKTEMVKGFEFDLTEMLAVDARLKGMKLIFRQPRWAVDPVYLLNSEGVIMQEWDYVPSMGQVDDACRLINASPPTN